MSLHFVRDTLLARNLIGRQKIAEVAASSLKLNFIKEKEWPKGKPEQ